MFLAWSGDYVAGHWKGVLELKHMHVDNNCDWILENPPNCHTMPIPLYWPSNGYTCTLHIHSANTRLSRLVCLSRASFVNPVNS